MYFYMYILTYINIQNTFLNYISQVMRAILGRGVELSWCQGVFCGIFIIRTLYNGGGVHKYIICITCNLYSLKIYNLHIY